jgi:hypothetical protein
MLFGCINPGNEHPIEDGLAEAGMVAIAIPCVLLGEVHAALQKAGHGLADEVLKRVPASGAHGDE